MMKRTPTVPASAPPLFSGRCFAFCVLSGLFIALAVFSLLLYGKALDREQRLREASLQRLTTAKATMRQSWKRAFLWGEKAAWQLGAASREAIPTLLAEYQRLWPEAGFSLFDHSAMLITGLSSVAGSGVQGESIADLPGLKEMVLKALDGEISQDYTRLRGFLSLGVAFPVQGRDVRAVVVSLPLDSFYLQAVKNISGANIAVAPLEEATQEFIGDMANAGNTFSQSDNAPGDLWPKLGRLLKQQRLAPDTPLFLLDEPFHAGLEPLVNSEGVPVGLLIAAPLHDPETGVPLWHFVASAGAGILASLLLGLALRFRERRMLAAMTGDLYALARDADAQPRNSWPTALAGAFNKISDTLREYKILLSNAARERYDSRETFDKAAEGCTLLDMTEYRRLFDSLPVGAFQATTAGRLLQVNPVFAMLLGYDSPVGMLTACGSFADLCLYGEGLRNPLKVLLEQGTGRHILSLRRRDGKVRHFAVICSSITAHTGDEAGILEGFLLDRDLEERVSAAERESLYAKKERESLALLLAATCRQTRSYFALPARPPSRAGDEATNAPGNGVASVAGAADAASHGPAPWPEFRALSGPGASATPEAFAAMDEDEEEERLERRKSIVSLKAVLNDIYQIAMTEVDGSPPVNVPMEFRHFMKRLCHQALPTLFSRGISLRCEIADTILARMSGPAPILRHALLRALLVVTAPARGGWACLSVTRDPNAPRLPGMSRLLFSASWHAFSSEFEEMRRSYASGQSGEYALGAPEEGYSVFVAEAAGGTYQPADRFASSVLDISHEQEVIRYLARKMRGDLLEGIFSRELKSLQIVVPLEHLTDMDAEAAAGQAHDARRPVQDIEALAGEPEPRATAENNGAEAHAPRRPLPDDATADIWVLPPTADTWITGIPDQGDTGVPEPEEDEITQAARASGLNLLVMDNEGDAGYQGREGFAPDLDAEDSLAGAQNLAILLIDANLNNRLLFSLFLKDTKHHITEANDGQEGVAAFQRGKYDVIFMDMEMPLMNGYQVSRIIRALEADKGEQPTPIVGMTSYALPELRRECMLAGCTEFLTRPFSKHSLLTLLDAFAKLKNEQKQ